MKKILLFGLVLALFTTAASAQVRSNAVRHHRIESGVHSGQVTRGEKFRLQKDRIRYNQAKRKALRDGRLTPRERRMLNAMKRHDSRRIYVMKHNNRRRAF
jgi:hypothetical protein